MSLKGAIKRLEQEPDIKTLQADRCIYELISQPNGAETHREEWEEVLMVCSDETLVDLIKMLEDATNENRDETEEN
jgi:hypothetical protein